jgi:hypothetical protein
MAHYAKVLDGKVINVIVADEDFINTFVDNTPGEWVQTSYNTWGGQHLAGGTPLRKNFAGVGFTYDSVKDAFIPPQPFASWILNNTTCLWEAPVDHPDDGEVYLWNEEDQTWDAQNNGT